MGLFDSIMADVDGVAAKVGLQPDQVQALTATLESKIGGGTDQMAAIEQAAQEHGVPVEAIQAVLAHVNTQGGVASELGSLAEGLFSKS